MHAGDNLSLHKRNPDPVRIELEDVLFITRDKNLHFDYCQIAGCRRVY